MTKLRALICAARHLRRLPSSTHIGPPLKRHLHFLLRTLSDPAVEASGTTTMRRITERGLAIARAAR